MIILTEDCIFCKLISGEIPCAKIYEDDDFLAFLDISPVNKGHALIVTKEHYPTICDVPDSLLSKYLLAVKKVATAVHKGTGSDGYNVMQNNKKAAGQVIPHVHFHIIPRNSDDGLKFSWPNKTYEEGEILELKEKIIKVIAD